MKIDNSNKCLFYVTTICSYAYFIGNHQMFHVKHFVGDQYKTQDNVSRETFQPQDIVIGSVKHFVKMDIFSVKHLNNIPIKNISRETFH